MTSFLDYANDFFDVLKLFVQSLFSMQVSGAFVTVGSIFLVCIMLFVIITNFYPRG